MKGKLINFMYKKGIPRKIIKLVEMTQKDARAMVMIDGHCGDEFMLTRGVRQGDALSATLFNLALEAAVENITDNGHIIYKLRQVCAYADDVVLIARNEKQLQELYLEMRVETKKIGLEVNEEKTKYMVVSTREERRRNKNNLRIADRVFEKVEQFVYLGVEINSSNLISQEIQRRIMAGNRALYANIKLLKSRLITRKTKLKIYTTLIRPVITYASETWNISNNDANKLRVFERKIIRRIYGAIQENGIWRSRNNMEIQEILNNEDIVRYIKAQRLRWIGHVERMKEHRIPRKIYKASMTGRRRKGRPRNRWKDEVEEDLRRMNVRGWREKAKEKKEWRGVVRQAKAHIEL